MLKPINPISNRVADGRRHASRSIVITNLSALSSFVYRRKVIEAVEGESRETTLHNGGISLSDFEEHAIEYVDQGFAIVLMDHFTGGSIHSDGEDINSGEAVFYAQIEPIYFDDYGKRIDMLKNVPDWKPKKGDVFALVVAEDLIKWVEVVGVSGQSMHAHHGERYILNIRDRLAHLDPFIQHEQLLEPEASRFPILLADLDYSAAPIFNIVSNDPSKLSDDEVTTRIFKLVNMDDPQLAGYMSIIAIKHMTKSTQSPYYFRAEDQRKINVDIAHGEHFILSSSEPVRAIETSLGNLTNLLFMIDHVNVVRLIKESLDESKAVRITHDNKTVFELLPTHYDEVRKAYHFAVMVSLGSSSDYSLIFTDDRAYTLTIDTTAVQVTE